MKVIELINPETELLNRISLKSVKKLEEIWARYNLIKLKENEKHDTNKAR